MSSFAAIETVRGRLDEGIRDDVLGFWAQHGFGGAPARERLDQVVCVLRDHGAVAGISSAFAAGVELIGGRRFSVFRSLLPGAAAEHTHAMIRSTFQALDAEREDGQDSEALGFCVLLDPEMRRQLPREAEWRDPRLFYVGYLGDGTQVRIAYFSDQFDLIDGDGWTLAPGSRVDLFAQQDDVSPADVIALWTEAAGLSPEEAERRLSEVLMVGTDPQRRLVAVATAFLARNEQLRAQFWHYRIFVASDSRAAHFGVQLAFAGRDHLERRFVDGTDRRGIGMIYEIENESVRRGFPRGWWANLDFLLIGDNARGAHVRVHYFPGGEAPEPGE